MVGIVKSATALLLTLAAASNDVSEAASLQEEHHNLSNLTRSETNELTADLLVRVNKERMTHGLPAICSNKKLQAAAQRHVNNLSKTDYISDTGTDNSTPEQRITNAGYKWQTVEENIDSGSPSVDTVVRSWMKSACRNAIMGKYTMVGAAYAYNANTFNKHFWVQVYATGSPEESCDA